MLGTDHSCLALPTLNIIGKRGWRRKFAVDSQRSLQLPQTSSIIFPLRCR